MILILCRLDIARISESIGNECLSVQAYLVQGAIHYECKPSLGIRYLHDCEDMNSGIRNGRAIENTEKNPARKPFQTNSPNAHLKIVLQIPAAAN